MNMVFEIQLRGYSPDDNVLGLQERCTGSTIVNEKLVGKNHKSLTTEEMGMRLKVSNLRTILSSFGNQSCTFSVYKCMLNIHLQLEEMYLFLHVHDFRSKPSKG